MGESPSNIRKIILTNSTNDQAIDMLVTEKVPLGTFLHNPTTRNTSHNGMHFKAIGTINC